MSDTELRRRAEAWAFDASDGKELAKWERAEWLALVARAYIAGALAERERCLKAAEDLIGRDYAGHNESETDARTAIYRLWGKIRGKVTPPAAAAPAGPRTE